MSLVNISDVKIGNNPSSFFDPFSFEITFEVLSELKEDLEFKVVYVGSAESETGDQVLESVMVGPVPIGASKFVLEAAAPRKELLPEDDILGVTVVLLICAYRDKEFVRVGYYVNNEYSSLEMKENPPTSVDFNAIVRSILADKPRVTRFSIPWDETPSASVQKGMGTADAASAAKQMILEANAASMESELMEEA